MIHCETSQKLSKKYLIELSTGTLLGLADVKRVLEVATLVKISTEPLDGVSLGEGCYTVGRWQTPATIGFELWDAPHNGDEGPIQLFRTSSLMATSY